MNNQPGRRSQVLLHHSVVGITMIRQISFCRTYAPLDESLDPFVHDIP